MKKLKNEKNMKKRLLIEVLDLKNDKKGENSGLLVKSENLSQLEL